MSYFIIQAGGAGMTAEDRARLLDTYTKEETDIKIGDLAGLTPETLATLLQLAETIGDNPEFVTAITTEMALKVDKVAGKELSSNNYSDEEKLKVSKLLADGTYSATNVVTDSTHLFATATEKATWDGKSSVVVSSTNGNVLVNGSELVVYVHPDSHTGASITQDSTHRFVSDVQTATWDGKSLVIDSTTNGNILINGVETNVYTLPSALAPTIITQDETHRFVSDTEKGTWNGKAGTSVASAGADGLMSSAHFTKVSGVETGANLYVHPTYHTPSVIAQDASNRFVTDVEKATWNRDKAFAIALMSPTDNLLSCSYISPINATLKTIKVQLDVAPSASTNLEIYIAGVKLTTIAYSTIATTYTAPANTNITAGDIIYIKILTANSTKALSAVFTVGDR